jgi:hypothetical protein
MKFELGCLQFGNKSAKLIPCDGLHHCQACEADSKPPRNLDDAFLCGRPVCAQSFPNAAC